MKRDELIALADEFDEIEVDTNGKCDWTAVANAQTHLRRRILSALEAPAAGDGEPVAWIDPKEFERLDSARGKRPLVGGLFRLHPTQEFDDDVAIYTAQPADAGMRWRHKKRGSTYTEVGIGRMQAASWVDLNNDNEHKVDMREVTIYRADSDGTLWVRPREEFEDGRFEALTAPGATTKSDGGLNRQARNPVGLPDSSGDLASAGGIAGVDITDHHRQVGGNATSEPSSTRSEVTCPHGMPSSRRCSDCNGY